MKSIEQVPRLPLRAEDGNKGTFGRVFIVGGSDGMIGAPAFAGLSALLTGSGLVQVATPEKNLNAVLGVAPELIGVPLTLAALEKAELADAVVVGPGLGQSPLVRKVLAHLIKLRDKPMVIDADALNTLAAAKTWPKIFRARAVLTPHPGEMKRLLKLIGGGGVPTDEAGRISVARRAAKAFAQVIVLKGHRTVVCAGERIFINTTGDSSLAKAGTGDVLSGIIGSLLGQGMAPFDAACLGAHVHGLAGERAGKSFGKRSVLARDVIDALPSVLRAIERSDKSV